MITVSQERHSSACIAAFRTSREIMTNWEICCFSPHVKIWIWRRPIGGVAVVMTVQPIPRHDMLNTFSRWGTMTKFSSVRTEAWVETAITEMMKTFSISLTGTMNLMEKTTVSLDWPRIVTTLKTFATSSLLRIRISRTHSKYWSLIYSIGATKSLMFRFTVDCMTMIGMEMIGMAMIITTMIIMTTITMRMVGWVVCIVSKVHHGPLYCIWYLKLYPPLNVLWARLDAF
mmetsp:Transcript_16419/g.34602  ORF Transcript_16419/g.34602 Transcript_16419/m.34602 type:complete len:230 (-) Transcript_16419:148-837(-)